MTFHLNFQRLISCDDPEPKSAPLKRSYLATYPHSNGLHRITIKAEDRFSAHDKAKDSTPDGMTFTHLREVKKPARTARKLTPKP